MNCDKLITHLGKSANFLISEITFDLIQEPWKEEDTFV